MSVRYFYWDAPSCHSTKGGTFKSILLVRSQQTHWVLIRVLAQLVRNLETHRVTTGVMAQKYYWQDCKLYLTVKTSLL